MILNEQTRRDVMSRAWTATANLLHENEKIKVTIAPLTRSDEQNAKLHAMLSDIAAKKVFNGQKLSIEQWKMVFVSGHAIATGGQAQMAIGLEGEVINLRESTAKMGVKRCASLIEYIQAWGAMNDMRFRETRDWHTLNAA